MLLNSKGTKVQKVKSPLVTSCPLGPLLSSHQSTCSSCIFCLYSVAQGYPGELAIMIEMICVPWTHVAIRYSECGQYGGGTGFLI